MTDREARSYRLEALDASGVFLGLGVLQCALLGIGIVLTVAAISAQLHLLMALSPAVAANVLSFGRAAGVPLSGWLPIGWSWLSVHLGRGRHWAPPLPLITTSSEAPAAPLPPCLAGIEILAIPHRGNRQLGAFHDTGRHTLTAAVTVTGPQFIVEPRSEQERLLAGWGDVLAQFAVERGAVTGLSWSDLARPSGMHQHHHWAISNPGGTTNPDAAASYTDLLGQATAMAIAHDVTITITVARDRLGRGAADPERLTRALLTAVDALLRALRTAGLTASDPFDPSGLQRLLRSRLDPTHRTATQATGRLADRLGLTSATSCGPLAMEIGWDHLRVDGAFHRTWWIGTWPRMAQPPAWLEPFLSAGGLTRTITVHLQPTPAHQSRRRIERDLVKLESDAVTKEDKGRRVDARHRRATQALLDRESELVAGYPEVAYAGLVTVTATSLEQLEDHGEIIEQLARENGMDLRVLLARQDLAWAAGLPLGLAPRTVLDAA